jgi:hypothetical protein
MLPEHLISTISFESPNRVIEPYNWVEHIPFAFWLMESVQPRIFVELGAYSGNSYLAFCQAVKKLNLPTKCYAVDTWEGDVHVGKYSNNIYRDLNDYNTSKYVNFSQLIRSTFNEAVSKFEDHSIDLLHIDGAHSYEDVLNDFKTWLPKCSDRAIVIFHDTNVYLEGFGVYKLWEELSAKYPHFEFPHGNGLGVLVVGTQISKPIATLTSLSTDENLKTEIQEIYARLGKSVHELALCHNKQSKVEGSFAWRFISGINRATQISFHIVKTLFSGRSSSQAKGLEMESHWESTFLGRLEVLAKDSRFYKYYYNRVIRKRANGFTIDDYEAIFDPALNKSPYYRPESHPVINKSSLRTIAFYLPQFHAIPENDEWWGKGFTEWTNVTKSPPQFMGHYQPHLPGELGFYDLRYREVLKRQMQLATQYGIHGFCLHHYWFSGRRLLEEPLNQILNDASLELPFCLCWANENWTRRWDGRSQEVLISQTHSHETDRDFIKDISRALRDPRYIRVNGRPLLIVYRLLSLPDPAKTAEIWRKYCLENGIGDIYLVAAQIYGLKDPRAYNFDAAVEFPPHNIKLKEQPVDLLNPGFNGSIHAYSDLIGNEHMLEHPNYPLFKTVFPDWDNSARRIGRGNIFHQSTPDLFAEWLDLVCRRTVDHATSNDEKLVFINAWNEWAEGAHLEPDRRFGYAYLEALAKTLSKYSD